MRACDIASEMKKYVGGASFITLTELTGFLGRKDPKAVKQRYLLGLERIDTRYFIPDVARVLFDSKRHVA